MSISITRKNAGFIELIGWLWNTLETCSPARSLPSRQRQSLRLVIKDRESSESPIKTLTIPGLGFCDHWNTFDALRRYQIVP